MDNRKIRILTAVRAMSGNKTSWVQQVKRLLVRWLSGSRLLFPFPDPTPCDILFLHGTERSLKQTELLWKALEHKHLTIHHEIVASLNRNWFKRKLLPPDQNLPDGLLSEHALAKFCIAKHQPKVVCATANAFAAFIRHELHKQTGGKSIYIFSAPPNIRSAAVVDADYLFLHGKTSLQTICESPVRLGHAKAVLTGSYCVTPDNRLEPNRDKKKILFFSTWYAWISNPPTKTVECLQQTLLHNVHIVIQWAKEHPEFQLFVKIHPSEDPKYIYQLTRDIPNITVLNKSISMRDALKDASLALLSWSAASLEAAMHQRPLVIVNAGDLRDSANTLLPHNHLALEDFFLRARTAEELHQHIVYTFEHYDRFVERCHEFIHQHLEHTTDAIDFMTHCIEAIYHGKEDFPYRPIQEELSGLTPYLSPDDCEKLGLRPH